MILHRMKLPHEDLVSGWGKALATAKNPTKAKTLKKRKKDRKKLTFSLYIAKLFPKHFFQVPWKSFYLLLTLMMKAEKARASKMSMLFILSCAYAITHFSANKGTFSWWTKYIIRKFCYLRAEAIGIPIMITMV